MHKVYLAGPITGLTYGASNEWRTDIAPKLEDLDMAAYSPLRAKSFLSRLGVLTGDPAGYALHAGLEAQLSGQRGIVRRDYNDVLEADAVLVNLAGATQVSIGTMFEMAWAYDCRIPIVLVMENEGNPHEHGFVKEAYTYRTPCLDEAVELLSIILNP